MDKVAYAALIAFGAFTTGMGVMAFALYTRAYLILHRPNKLGDHAPRHLWLAVTKAGVVITQGVLLWRVISAGVVDSSPAVWFYLIGLCVAGVGIMGQCAMLYKDMPKFEEEVK